MYIRMYVHSTDTIAVFLSKIEGTIEPLLYGQLAITEKVPYLILGRTYVDRKIFDVGCLLIPSLDLIV